jgi:hypothetical protein
MLKFFCFLTGAQYNMVKADTPQSRLKVSTFGTALMIPVIMWAIIGFLVSKNVMENSLPLSIIISGICAGLIFLLERIIIMSTANKAMAAIRILLGASVAFLGAIAIDEVVFKKDIDHQLNKNMQQSKELVRINGKKDFDEQYDMATVKANIDRAKLDYEKVEDDVKKEVVGKGSGHIGVGRIARLHLQKAYERKADWSRAQAHYDSLLKAQADYIDNKVIEAEKEFEDGLLVRVEALFQLIRQSNSMLIIYIAFTLVMFFLEFMVILVKMNMPESNYERRVKLIEQIGQRRMQMLSEQGSPLVSQDFALPNALAARDAIGKRNGSLFN